MSQRELRVTRTTLRSGRVILAAWEPWKDGERMPKERRVGMRDLAGWWLEVEGGDALLAMTKCGWRPGERSTRWHGYWEAS